MKKILKIVGIVFGAIAATVILVGLLKLAIAVVGVVWLVDTGKDAIENYEQEQQSLTDTYNSIPAELLKQDLFPEDLTYAGSSYGWGAWSVDRSNRYYFYISPDLYDEYKHYWLEDVNESEYYEGLNEDLLTRGDYVFRAINVDDWPVSYETETDGVHFDPAYTYYRVAVYDEAIYGQYVFASNSGGETRYNTDTTFDCKYESRSALYYFHMEEGKWVIEEAERS